MTRLSYNLDDLRELRTAIENAMTIYRNGGKFDLGLCGFLTISCRDDQGREARITSNSHGEGLFHWNERNGCYDQTMGTCQFSMAAWSDQRARRELRQRWERIYGAEG